MILRACRSASFTRSEDPTLTWLEAPVLIGVPSDVGESVRRKLRRQGTEMLRRKALELGEAR
ncbi:hypothetical protein [Streptomyces albicerus]|uniref:hypothetical protein n=1 Tax=Streptomyces albicerus TaxID=2569859 RepID=UPI00124BBD46|nr:hypothetical protein [Streptomyces albicerus]